MFNDFIKHYNIIRSILRDIFLYGCFSRESLGDRRRLSSRKVSYEIRRIQQYVETEFIKTDMDGRNKLLVLTGDSIRNTENFLVKTYMTKSFTPSSLILYFNLLMLINAKDHPCCLREIEESLIEKGALCYDHISRKTVERKLIEMCKSLGILQYKTIKRTKYYHIAEDILRDLNNAELKELITAVSLFKNIMFPVTAGYYLEQSLIDYTKYERKVKWKRGDDFQYKSLHFHPVIEEQMLYKALTAIHERRYVILDYNLPESKAIINRNEPLKPYKIRYDINYGRFYLVSFDKNNRCVLSRLDRIEDIDIQKNKYEIQNLDRVYERSMCNSWSSVPLTGGNKPKKIVLEITIDEPRENYIVEKIVSEVQGGTLEKVGEGCYQLSFFVNESLEIVPWVRSYSGYIKVLQGRGLMNRVTEDWKEMLNQYGAF